MRFPCLGFSQAEEARGSKEPPHLRGHRGEKGGGRLCFLSLSFLETDTVVAAAAVGLSQPGGRGNRLAGRKSFENSRERTPVRADPTRLGGQAGSAQIPGCIASRPLPSPRPASPRPWPPPSRLREAGTRRRRRLLQSRLSHSLGNPAVAAPLEAEQPSREPASGRSGRLTAEPTDRRTAGQPGGSGYSGSAMSWGTELWVSRGERRPARTLAPEGLGMGRRRRLERVGRSPALAKGGGTAVLCVRTPLPSRQCFERLLVGAPAPAAAVGLRAANWTAGGAARWWPRPPPSSRFPLSPPPSLSGRLARCRAALLCLSTSPPRGGGGGPLSRRGAVRGRGGGSPRPRARARVPGARASPDRGVAGSREAPPAAVAPGRGSRAALFRVRPLASQAQPTRPFPSPRLLVLAGVASGTLVGPPLAAVLSQGGGFYDLN